MPIMTGLSGNEMFCLNLKGYSPGELVIGNSVFSMGFAGALGAIGRGLMGGEVTEITNIIHEGRLEALNRMAREAQSHGGVGITGVSNELRTFHGHTEFLSVASTLHRGNGPVSPGEQIEFSTSADGQELYCQLDAGFTPVRFVFGNVAYSVGVGGSILGKLKSLARGEIKEFSDVFNRTRHLALDRILGEARAAGADAVVGIETRTVPFAGVHEMLMMGTASRHPALSVLQPPPGASIPYLPGPAANAHAAYPAQPVSSDLTNEEMWNIVHMGYMPLKLVLGTAVYSLGVVGGIKAMFKGLTRGEIPELTSLIYDAREHAIGLIRDEANAIGADDVVGVRTHITEFGGLLEFLAIGTAVKRIPNLTTLSPTLPPQAVMKDKDTWIGERASQIDRPSARPQTGVGAR
jgi:uncharacterized protein YbjQ (UPF0145 family)